MQERIAELEEGGVNIDTGDTVFHKPTGETWLVAYVKGGKLAWCGWPPGEADVADCELKKKSTPEHRRALLEHMANHSQGFKRYAKARLEAEE